MNKKKIPLGLRETQERGVIKRCKSQRDAGHKHTKLQDPPISKIAAAHMYSARLRQPARICTGWAPTLKCGHMPPFLTQKQSPIDNHLQKENLVFYKGVSRGKQLLKAECMFFARSKGNSNSPNSKRHSKYLDMSSTWTLGGFLVIR